jgi:P4 family phage/plasmid primase-like protien
MLDEVPIAQVFNDFYNTDFPLNGMSELSVSCPCHHDRTPSLRIYYHDNTAYCFGESAFFTPTTVIQRARNCTSHEAERIGRELYQLCPLTIADEHARYVEQLREKYLAATHEALLSVSPALDALAKRGVTLEETVTRRIGYHAPDFDALSREQLVTLGITDAFADMIILPWLLHGSCVGLQAWDYRQVTNVKYRIPSGTTKFVLGDTDPDHRVTFIVEGYFNQISCNQAGYAALCTIGKHPSEEAVRYLQDLPADSLIILFDVGAEAEAYELAKRLGPEARLGDLKLIRGQYSCPTELSEGFDPNDLHQTVGEANFKAALDNVVATAVSVFNHWLSNVRERTFGNKLERSQALAEGQELIARLPPEHRGVYRKDAFEIAQQLGFSRQAFDDQFTVILRTTNAREHAAKRDHEYFNGATFVPKRLADELLAECRFLTFRDTEEVYYYVPAEGIYKPGGEQLIQAEAQERLGLRARNHFVNEVLAYIRRANYIDRERVDRNHELLPVENGVLNIRTGTFVAYSPDLYFLNKLPVQFNEGATCPAIEAALGEVVPPEDLPVLQEIAGYSLIRQYLYHKAIMLLGSGENGKSLFLNLVGSLLGSQNVATRSLQDLIYNRFATADLYQKYANVCADIPSTALKQTGVFKMLTGEDLIAAERKHKDPFVFRNYAKLLFSANELPATQEQTHAFFRRWIILRFPYRFVKSPKAENEKQQDPELFKKLATPEELSGLLNWALRGVRRILENGGFSGSVASDEVKALWIQKTDSLQAFVNTRVKVAAGLNLSKAGFNKAYRQYCEEFEVAAVDPSVVGRRLPALLPTKSAKPILDGKQEPSWKDIALMSPDADEPSNRAAPGEDVQNSELPEKKHACLDYEHKQHAPVALDDTGDSAQLPSLVAVDSHTMRAGDEENAVSFTLHDTVAVDLETTGLDSATDHIVLGSVVDGDNALSFVDCQPLDALLADPAITKVFHNAPFDVAFLEAAGFTVRNYEDTRLMAQVLTNNTETYTLASLAQTYLGIELDKSLQSPENWEGPLTNAHVAYNVWDSAVTLQLYHELKEKLQERGLELVYERERNALPVLRHLIINGMYLDAAAWQRDLARFKQEQAHLADAIRAELQAPRDFNLNSPAQILAVLANRSIDLPDTKEETLRQNTPNYPILAKFIEYKQLGSLITKSGTKLLEKLGPDGRLHPEFQLIGTITGRMTSSKPNLQQIDSRLKPYFKPAPQHKYVIADYSQIQLRILAALSGDPRMLEVYERGEDLHAATARAILHKEEITKEDRKLAKAINFGIIFGSSAKGLQASIVSEYAIEISLREAEQFRNAFFTEYTGVQRWHDSQIKATVVESPGGRKWENLPKPGSANSKWRGRINYPIQAAEAEGVKEALILLLPELERHAEWKLVNAVHDELVLEVPDNEVDDAQEALVSCMKMGMQKIIATVPIEVDATVADCWEKQPSITITPRNLEQRRCV